MPGTEHKEEHILGQTHERFSSVRFSEIQLPLSLGTGVVFLAEAQQAEAHLEFCSTKVWPELSLRPKSE